MGNTAPLLTSEHLHLWDGKSAGVDIPTEKPVVVNGIPVAGSISLERSPFSSEWHIRSTYLRRLDKNFGFAEPTSGARKRLYDEAKALVSTLTPSDLRAAEAKSRDSEADSLERKADDLRAEADRLVAKASALRHEAALIKENI